MPNGKVRLAAVYGNGAAMGFSPQEVGRMSVWKYLAAIDGYVAANSPEDVGLSEGEKNELAEWLGI